MLACWAVWNVASPAAAQARLILNGGETLSRLAGSGRDGVTKAGKSESVALGHPRGVVFDSASNLYVADSRNHQVLRIAASGDTTIVAGTGEEGYAGDGAAATAARLSHPSSLALRPDGSLLIADTGNHRIRSVSSKGIITTIAGSAVPGDSGDGGPAASASLRRPGAVLVDASGRIVIADTGNHRIRRIDASGVISSIAGTGEEGDAGDGGAALKATLRSPSALALLPDGRVLIADASAHRIRSLEADGTVKPYSPQTVLRRPEGISIASNGDLTVADSGLQELLRVTSTAAATLAGDGTQGAAINGAATTTPLDSPSGAATDSEGNTALSDRHNHQVQRVTLPSLAFGSVPAGQQSVPMQLTVENGGSSSLTVTSVSLPSGFTTDPSSTCAGVPFRLASHQRCSVALVFAPVAQGAAAGLASVTSDLVPTAMVRLSGVATAPSSLAPSQTTMAAAGTISYAGASLQLTASVAGSLRSSPTGNVSFKDGSTVLSAVSMTASKATFATSALSVGSHAIRASYSGDSLYAVSDSAPTTVTVIAAPDFAFSASAASYSAKTSTNVIVPLTCLPLNGTLNHTVTLTVSGLPSGFSATFSPPVFTLGGKPAQSTLTILIPATVSSLPSSRLLVAAAAALMLPLCFQRRRRVAVAVFATSTLIAAAGCGGGFRAVSTGGSTTNSLRYNATVTATTAGALGDTLAHSIPVELVVTP